MRILNCLGSWPLSVVLAILAFSSAAVWAELALEHASIRQDRYNIPTEQWQWAEAWGEIRQYFPRYYRPAGSPVIAQLGPCDRDTIRFEDGTTAIAQIRARENRFYLGLVQGQTPLREYYAKFFNTLYNITFGV